MKKYTFALMLAAGMLCAVSPLFAEGMVFGAKGGLIIANAAGEDSEGLASKMAFVGGVFMCYNISEIFAVQPELLYSMKGAKVDIPIFDVSVNFNYIEIPLLLKATLPTGGKIKPSVYVGPALGFLTSAKVSAEGSSVDIKEYFDSVDFGIVAGAGIGIEMEKGVLSFEARYERSMSSVAKKGALAFEEYDLETEPDLKNSDISIMVGYGFAL